MLNPRRITVLLAAGFLSASLFAERPLNAGPGRDQVRAPKAAVVDPDQDDATLRRAAMREWWGEYTPEYRQFLMGAAQRERERWGSLIPGNGHILPLKAAGNHWTNLGPTTASYEWNGSSYSAIDSGRPVAIVVDPTDANVIYNTTAGGGVWKTTDGGSTWNPMTDSLGSLSCGYLAMDPNDHNTLYLGLGDAFDGTGIGLVKSTDGGTTWSSVVFLGSTTVINSIAVSPTNSQIVLVNTNGGLYRSTDGGSSFSATTVGGTAWTLAYGGGTKWATSITTGTNSTSGSYNGAAIYYSTDDGATWTASTGFASTGGRTSLASAPSDRTVMYAMVASDTDTTGKDLQQFYRSADSGASWTSLGLTATKKYANTNTESSNVNTLLNGQGWYNHFLAVDPSTSTTFYAGGALLLCEVTNATTTPVYTQKTNWLAQFSLPYVHADFHAGTIDQNGVLYVGTDGGIFKRTTHGSPDTWTSSLNVGIISHLCYSVGSSLNNTSAVITGMQDNGTRVRSGSTSTFDQPMGGDGFGSHIHAVDATKMLGTLYYSRVYKSTTSGSTGGSFASAYGGISEAGNSSTGVFITRLTPALADTNGDTMFTFSTLKVYKTTVYGGSGSTSWAATSTAPITSGTIRNVGSAKSNISTIGVVCSGGRYFLSSNGGSTWSAPTALSNNGNSLSYISFSPVRSNVVYIASVAPDSTKTHLWVSFNSGSSWTALDTGTGFPTGVPVNCILEDPNDIQTLYAGTHEGVYRSTDAGSTWSRFGAGLPLVNVTDLYLAPDSSLLRVSTFGRGIWEFNTNASTVSASITLPATNQTINTGDSVSFTGTATDADPASTLSYGWDFGDGVTASGASTSHVFTNATGSDVIYTVTFTATGSTGGLGTVTRSITVHPVGDTTAPTVGTPSASAQRGTVTLSATASDNVGVTKVEFYVDGSLVGTSTSGSPFSVSLNTLTLADGAHTLVAKAYDAANNSTTSSSASLPVDNTIPTGLSASETGTSGTITFSGTATDNIGVTKVLFFIDNVGKATDFTAPYGFSYDSTNLTDGNHIIAAKAFDAAGNNSSASFLFCISNIPDATLPVVSNLAVSGTSGTVIMSATATDNVAIHKVMFFIDGVGVATDYWAPYQFQYSTLALTNGTHLLTAKAFDAAGNNSKSYIYFTVAN